MARKIYHRKLVGYTDLIDAMELPARINRPLAKAGIVRVSDLAERFYCAFRDSKTEDIYAVDVGIKGLGDTGLSTLLDILAEFGWSERTLVAQYMLRRGG